MSSKNTNLVIVESGTKCKTISKYLNNIPELKKFGTWTTEASVGHIYELDKKNGIEIENNFKMNYKISRDKVKVVNNLIKKAKEAKSVWISSDNDREGEAIGWALVDALKLKKYYRAVFNEITPAALKIAFLNPRQIDMDMVQSQEGRRAIDRIIGFKLTACLWKAFTSQSTLSAGRVQSCALLIIVNKETDIDKFKTESYYKVNGTFAIGKIAIEEANLYKDTTILKINTKEKALTLLKLLIKNEKQFFVKEITNKRISEKPSLPYITSTLQQDGSSKLRMSIKQIMSLAQQLYEKGHITYMRTDSYNISETAHDAIEEYILKKYGAANYKRRASGKKSKGAQLAHEAVRPTDITKETIAMTEPHNKLYDMIRKRTLASQMADAIYQEGAVKIANKSLPTDTYFLGKAKVLITPGYLTVYNIAPEKIDVDKWLKNIQEANDVSLTDLEANNTFTVPPSRYSEATLIKKLETDGIGRPSTFASIITKLYDRNYIEKKDTYGPKLDYIHYKYKKSTNKITEIHENTELYTEKSKLVATESGKAICDYLTANFSDVINIGFTSEVEEKLDEISEAKLTKLKFLQTFYKKFAGLLKDVHIEKTKTSLTNDQNKKAFMIGTKEYIVREGKYGALIETMNGDKKEFTGLKPYMALVKKNIEDIDENDVKAVLKFPKVIGKVDKLDVVLVIGPYGFYMKYNDKNYKIPYKVKNDILKMTNYNSLLEYIV